MQQHQMNLGQSQQNYIRKQHSAPTGMSQQNSNPGSARRGGYPGNGGQPRGGGMFGNSPQRG
jgi:hypothetical protein